MSVIVQFVQVELMKIDREILQLKDELASAKRALHSYISWIGAWSGPFQPNREKFNDECLELEKEWSDIKIKIRQKEEERTVVEEQLEKLKVNIHELLFIH